MSKLSANRNYSIVSGFFAQDDPSAIPTIIGALPPRFGLLDDSPERWTNFRSHMLKLNNSAPEGVQYKVLFLGRHGQGYHNLAEEKYGTEAWDEYYSKLYGDSEITWGPDPLLTPLGVKQAKDACSVWLAEMQFDMPLPERCYASPLHRALSTWEVTLNGNDVLPNEGRKVLILENLREENGVHTCDMRNPRSVIQRYFPSPIYTFEDEFTEEDVIWRADARETKDHVKERARFVLDQIFEEEKDIYISVTAHGGIINGFLATMGRTAYALPTGGVLPLVVRSEIAPISW